MFVQLSVNKAGQISGAYTNALTGEKEPVAGQIDKATQRVAFHLAKNTDSVVEAGAYNLSQDVASCKVYFGKAKPQTWLLVRLPESKVSDAPTPERLTSTPATTGNAGAVNTKTSQLTRTEPESVFATLPKSEVYIVQGQVPVNPFEPLREINPQANQFPHKYSLDAAAPVMEFSGGELRIVSQNTFPIATKTGATMLVNPGSIRELHWHPNADEWQFVLSGRARVTIFGAHARTKTAEFGQGEVGFVKQGFGHHIEQFGSEPLRMLLIFNSPVYEEINLSAWFAAKPASIVEDNFGLTKAVVDKLPRKPVGFTSPAGFTGAA